MIRDRAIDCNLQGQRDKETDGTRQDAQQKHADEVQPVWSGLANDPCVKIGLRTNVTVPSARIGRIAENSSHAKPAKNQNSPAQVHSTSIGHDVGPNFYPAAIRVCPSVPPCCALMAP